MNMCAGTEAALAHVVALFGAVKPHCAYLFANRRANRMTVLVHDGVGIWPAAKRLTKASFTGRAFIAARKLNSTLINACAGARFTVAACWYKQRNRALAVHLLSKVSTIGRKINLDETIIVQLSHEIAIQKRRKFAKRSEQISPAEGSLTGNLLNTDLEAIEAELNALRAATASEEIRREPKRALLPPQFSRTVIRHEPENTL